MSEVVKFPVKEKVEAKKEEKQKMKDEEQAKRIEEQKKRIEDMQKQVNALFNIQKQSSEALLNFEDDDLKKAIPIIADAVTASGKLIEFLSADIHSLAESINIVSQRAAKVDQIIGALNSTQFTVDVLGETLHRAKAFTIEELDVVRKEALEALNEAAKKEAEKSDKVKEKPKTKAQKETKAKEAKD